MFANSISQKDNIRSASYDISDITITSDCIQHFSVS